MESPRVGHYESDNEEGGGVERAIEKPHVGHRSKAKHVPCRPKTRLTKEDACLGRNAAETGGTEGGLVGFRVRQ